MSDGISIIVNINLFIFQIPYIEPASEGLRLRVYRSYELVCSFHHNSYVYCRLQSIFVSNRCLDSPSHSLLSIEVNLLVPLHRFYIQSILYITGCRLLQVRPCPHSRIHTLWQISHRLHFRYDPRPQEVSSNVSPLTPSPVRAASRPVLPKAGHGYG